MARNRRKKVKDKDNMKTVRKEAKKKWRNKKAPEKALKTPSQPKKRELRSERNQPVGDRAH